MEITCARITWFHANWVEKNTSPQNSVSKPLLLLLILDIPFEIRAAICENVMCFLRKFERNKTRGDSPKMNTHQMYVEAVALFRSLI